MEDLKFLNELCDISKQMRDKGASPRDVVQTFSGMENVQEVQFCQDDERWQFKVWTCPAEGDPKLFRVYTEPTTP